MWSAPLHGVQSLVPAGRRVPPRLGRVSSGARGRVSREETRRLVLGGVRIREGRGVGQRGRSCDSRPLRASPAGRLTHALAPVPGLASCHSSARALGRPLVLLGLQHPLRGRRTEQLRWPPPPSLPRSTPLTKAMVGAVPHTGSVLGDLI